MLEYADMFTLSAIDQLHANRTVKIHGLLQPGSAPELRSDGPPDAGLHYAVAHHLLDGAEMAARSGDTDALTWYRTSASAVTTKLSTPTVVGPRIVIHADMEDLQRSSISETPFVLLGPDSTSAVNDPLALSEAAFQLGADMGFAALLRGHAAIVCLLRAKQLGATLDSWTISRLPGTVFTDHVGETAILARDLIHEAGHNWLNDALSAEGIKVSEDVTFFSPWKDTQRPAFGFIHACWSFPLTMIYAESVLQGSTGAVRDYLSAYLRQQCEMLAGTADDHDRALRLLPNPELREKLRHVHQAASAIER